MKTAPLNDRQRRSKQLGVYASIAVIIALMVIAFVTGNLFALFAILTSAFLGWHIFYLSYEARYGIKPFADVTRRRTSD